MTFNSHADFSDISYVMTYVTFYDKTLGDGNPIFWSLPSTATSLELDSSRFQSGHEYYGYLEFFHQYSDPGVDFFGAIKVNTTSFAFTTRGGGSSSVPDSGSTVGLFVATLGLFVGLRRFQRRA
jgi:hypothetical protein